MRECYEPAKSYSPVRWEVEQSYDLGELKMIREMLLKIELPFDEEHLLPHEIPQLIQFKSYSLFWNKRLVPLKIRRMDNAVHYFGTNCPKVQKIIVNSRYITIRK